MRGARRTASRLREQATVDLIGRPEPDLSGEVRTIPLTRGFSMIVDAGDYEWLSQWTWRAGGKPQRPYAVRSTWDAATGKRVVVYAHRLLANAPSGMIADHRDHNSLNNRRANLRACTHAENCRNKPTPKANTSGFKGVQKAAGRGKWIAIISAGQDRRSHLIGYFTDPREAALAYDAAARELHGEFAYLNFPEGEGAQ